MAKLRLCYFGICCNGDLAQSRLPLEGTTQVALSCLFEAIHLELSPQATDEDEVEIRRPTSQTPHPAHFARHLLLKEKSFLHRLYFPLPQIL